MNVNIPACVNGDKQAWDDFVQRTSSIIYAAVNRAARGHLATQNDIEDRMQDVYVRLIRNDFRLLKTYDSSRASLSTWLTLVTRSVVYEQMQKKTLPVVPLESAEIDSGESERSENPLAHAPALALDMLSERQRLVLRMLFDEGMSVEEAARRMDVDPQTIRSTKHKALSRLRENLPGFTKRPGSRETGQSGDVSPESSL